MEELVRELVEKELWNWFILIGGVIWGKTLLSKGIDKLAQWLDEKKVPLPSFLQGKNFTVIHEEEKD